MGHLEKPFQLWIGAACVPVTPAPDDHEGDGSWTFELDGARFYFDLPDGPADLVPEGVWVRCSFGSFDLCVRRNDGRVEYRAELVLDGAVVASDVSTDEERALWELANALPPALAPKACFFCRHSEVEKSTGWGHLCCNVREAAAHERHVETGNRLWPFLTNDWVDEWHSCSEWKLRPAGFGYRGGGHRDG